jgi:hypothetical protein
MNGIKPPHAAGAGSHARSLRLVEKDDKTPKDFKEIDLLARQLDL